MLRKFAIALFATTVLAGPVLAADAVKPTTPKAPVATTSTTAPAKTDAGTPATNGVKTGKDIKFNPPVTPDTKTVKPGTAGAVATDVKTIKAEKNLKIAKVVSPSHRHHSHAWYVAHSHYWHMVHHGKHFGHTMTAKVSKPMKHIYVHQQHHEATPVVKANKDVPSSQPTTPVVKGSKVLPKSTSPVVKANKEVPSKTQ
jgi:hypothetical protein